MSDCHEGTTAPRAASGKDIPLIALAGQPNMGKSTLFNLLTGLNQHVGNWTGKTVERREGTFTFEQSEYCLVDLPGTYSLTANSPEEVVAREFIVRERPQVVVAVVCAAHLERSLYLVAELLALTVPVVVALNMMDVAAQEGIKVQPEVLAAALGVPVIPMIASKATGVREMLQVIQAFMAGQIACTPKVPAVRADHQEILQQLTRVIAPYVPAPYPVNWVALKLFEGDAEITRMMEPSLPSADLITLQEILRAHDDAFLAVASGRYEWIGQIICKAVIHPRVGQIGITERLDRWAAHPLWGLLILAALLGLIFALTFTLGTHAQDFMEAQLAAFTAWVSDLLINAPSWLRNMIVAGAIGGAGSVLTFLPILVIFFAAFALLEDVGYMARAAYVMDNLMHLMGLHGKSFLPLFLGFGCNVPAIMGTRIIDSWPARLLTILIAPLVPCTARMVVVAFIAPLFFGDNAIWVSWGLIMMSLITLIGSGILLNYILFQGQRAAFIMEMPLYHIPNVRTIGLLVWQRAKSFVIKAGTAILGMSLFIWVLSFLPNGELNTSFLAQFGKLLEPLGKLMGFDWRLTVALITSFPAKENAIATLGILFGNDPESGLAEAITRTFSVASGLSFLVVTMLFIPCMATIAVIKQETNSWRWALISMALYLGLSVAAGSLTYNLAVLFGY